MLVYKIIKAHIGNSYRSSFKIAWFITILLFFQAAAAVYHVDNAWAWPFRDSKNTSVKSENLNDRQKLNNDGLKLFESGDYDGAADKFLQILSVSQNDPEARYNLGMCYYLKGRNDDAIKEFSSALKKNPDFIEAQQYLSQAYEKKISELSQKGAIDNAVKTATEYSRQYYISRADKERIEILKTELIGRKRADSEVTQAGGVGHVKRNNTENEAGVFQVPAGENRQPQPPAAELAARPDVQLNDARSEKSIDVISLVISGGLNDNSCNKVIDFIKSSEPDSAGMKRLESALNSAVENDLKDYNAHLALGVLYKKKKMNLRSDYHFQTAAIIDPANLRTKTIMNESDAAEQVNVSSADKNDAANSTNDSASVEIMADDDDGSGRNEDVPQTINSRLPNEIIALKHKLESNSASIEDLKKIACYYINKKDYEKAQRALYYSFSIDSSDNETNYLISYLKLTQKKKDEALTFAFSINPDTATDAKLLHDTGVLLMRLKKEEHAVRFFAKGIEADSRYIENYISLGVYYSRISDFDSARKYFNDALAVSPENMKVMYFKALSAKKEGNFEIFMDISKKMQAMAPADKYSKKIRRQMGISPGDQLLSYENEKTLIDTAKSYIKLHEYSKALIKAREAVKISPDNYEANEVLALAYKGAGDMINYTAYLLRANELNSSGANALKLGKAFFELGLNYVAYDYYAKYMSRNPGDTIVKFELVNALKNSGIFIPARTICETIVSKAKTPMEIETARNVLEDLKTSDTAETELGYLTDRGRDNLVKLLKALYGYEMYKPLERMFDAYSVESQKIDDIRDIYAATLIKSKQYAKAIEIYVNMINNDRTNYFPYYQIGVIYMKKNNFKRAEEYFRQALIYKPDDPEILTSLGDSCLYQRNIEDAEVAYLEAYNKARSVLLKEEAKLKLDKVRIKLIQNN